MLKLIYLATLFVSVVEPVYANASAVEVSCKILQGSLQDAVTINALIDLDAATISGTLINSTGTHNLESTMNVASTALSWDYLEVNLWLGKVKYHYSLDRGTLLLTQAIAMGDQSQMISDGSGECALVHNQF